MSTDSNHPPNSPIANSDGLKGIRLGLAAALGDINRFEDRDTYDTFGWPTDPTDSDYLSLYLRNGYARTVVDKPALTTWRDSPIIEDTADRDEPTEFESAVDSLTKELDLWSYATRVDRLAGIGQHGLIVLGLSDAEETAGFREDAREATYSGLDDIQQLRVYHEAQIDDITWGGPGSGRWGQPVEYYIDISDDIDEETEGEGTLDVHWSRVIDVPATRLLDDETLARPRCEPVLNNLLDIEKTLGSVAEMAYRGADKGLHINADPEKVDPSSLSEIDEDLQKWYHDVQPWIRTQGTEINDLGGEVADPEGIIEPNLDEIAAQTGIPKRELRGNQQGEQSGAEQDEKSYFGMIQERREQYATPHIVRALLNRLRELEILGDPAGGAYRVEWPDLTQLDESEVAELQQQRSKVVKNLATVVPELRGERAEEFVETGEFPEREDAGMAANDVLDESKQAVRQQFADSFGLDN